MKPKSPHNLALISKIRMAEKIEAAVVTLQGIHNLATDLAARQNLKRAIMSANNALRIYENNNLKVRTKTYSFTHD